MIEKTIFVTAVAKGIRAKNTTIAPYRNCLSLGQSRMCHGIEPIQI